jgi:hypothetical protein
MYGTPNNNGSQTIVVEAVEQTCVVCHVAEPFMMPLKGHLVSPGKKLLREVVTLF